MGDTDVRCEHRFFSEDFMVSRSLRGGLFQIGMVMMGLLCDEHVQ